jgi:hypothetical protein
VVYDKHPVAVSVPTPVRMTLQRGRYTFVVFRHAAEEPSWFHLAQLNPTAVKVVLAGTSLATKYDKIGKTGATFNPTISTWHHRR